MGAVVQPGDGAELEGSTALRAAGTARVVVGLLSSITPSWSMRYASYAFNFRLFARATPGYRLSLAVFSLPVQRPRPSIPRADGHRGRFAAAAGGRMA